MDLPADNVQPTAGLSLQLGLRSGRTALVLLVSIGLHLLLFWLGSHISFETETSPRSKPRTVRLSLNPPAPAVHPPEPAPSPEQTQAETPPPATQAQDTPVKQALPADTATATPEPAPSAAAILSSAKAVTKQMAEQMAEQDQTELKPTKSRVQSALEQVFDPPKEPPNIMQMANGTIRVVTDSGRVYCVKPSEDWRILGPEDNLPVNVTCN
jgi:uncharacterized membrane protein